MGENILAVKDAVPVLHVTGIRLLIRNLRYDHSGEQLGEPCVCVEVEGLGVVRIQGVNSPPVESWCLNPIGCELDHCASMHESLSDLGEVMTFSSCIVRFVAWFLMYCWICRMAP